MKDYSLTVTQVNEYVRKTLAGDPMLRNICITGEISNFKAQLTGHWYFTLKDEESAIGCAMFRGANARVSFRPQNGQKVRLMGSVGLYAKTGSYQFYAEYMEEEGLGELYLRYEKLKRALAAEGLFDPARKKPLPLLPKGIGIATSATGAVIHDIMRVSWRRYPGMPLYLLPVKVQGEGAAEEIAAAIRVLDHFSPVDVIIIGRGGGSMEDLWPFNEEIVARAVARCSKPVVSAVGHETDVTIADFAADERAATPSAAAEIAVPRLADLNAALEGLRDQLTHQYKASLSEKLLRLSTAQKRLAALSPAGRQERLSAALRENRHRLQAAMQTQMRDKSHRLESLTIRLRAAGPGEILRRGYTIVTDENGRVITHIASMSPGEKVCLRLADGTAGATVDEIHHDTVL